MIDPFTLATGIAGLLSLTIEVSKILYDQVNTIKNAPTEANDLLYELELRLWHHARSGDGTLRPKGLYCGAQGW